MRLSLAHFRYGVFQVCLAKLGLKARNYGGRSDMRDPRTRDLD